MMNATELAAAYGAQLTPLFDRYSCTLLSLSLLQPAETYFDLIGENIRARLLITRAPSGKEYCLRPEFTIPVCRTHVEEKGAVAARYAYFGPVFRYRPRGTIEFAQAGIELIADTDTIAADVEAVSFVHHALRQFGVSYGLLRLGDKALYEAIVAAMALPSAWTARLLRYFGDDAHLSRLIHGAGVKNAAQRYPVADDPDRLARMIEDKLAAHGLLVSGGRRVEEIAQRYLEMQQLTRWDAHADRVRDVLGRYLAIDCDAAAAVAQIERFLHRHALGGNRLEQALADFRLRLEGLDSAGIDLQRCRFCARFGRRLDYYTGFVFEIFADAGVRTGEPLAGGGRYDRLLQHLGAKECVPAVGCSVWLGRVARAAQTRVQ